jgi:hypothetical protein
MHIEQYDWENIQMEKTMKAQCDNLKSTKD